MAATAELTDIYRCCSYPSKEQKAQLGSAVVSALPGLKDPAGITGYVSYCVATLYCLF